MFQILLKYLLIRKLSIAQSCQFYFTSGKCFAADNMEPPDVLTPKEIDRYEQSLYSSKNPYSHPPRVIRENAIARISEQHQLNALAMQWYKHMPIPLHIWHRRAWQSKRAANGIVMPDDRTERKLRSSVHQPVKTAFVEKHHQRKSRDRLARSHVGQTKSRSTRDEKKQQQQMSSPQTVITVHRVLIRPSVIALENGGLHARLRYIIQLHRKLTGFYRLKIEARIDPDYPPIYVGNIQNVCAHWPANLPRTSCSLNKSRFYQKGQICFCHMPPGIYRQRLRLNLTNILDGLEVPRFLVNFLFNGKEMNIHLSLKLEDENDQMAGCLSLTLPLLLKSA
ncbi:unnamed protein product [Echinostoma caproni]|uniref:DUF5739 domain-containing protein n=1 Tax=Echinostoma caproni TaxID=27848 RepID=A0A183ADV9_9TREM|nr:unnamed protein product [Echinostoma caproni]